MRYSKWQILVSFCCFCCVTLLLSSCVRNQFDLQRYEEIVQELSPVDDVDENHDWQLSTTKMLTVDLSGLEDIERDILKNINNSKKISCNCILT